MAKKPNPSGTDSAGKTPEEQLALAEEMTAKAMAKKAAEDKETMRWLDNAFKAHGETATLLRKGVASAKIAGDWLAKIRDRLAQPYTTRRYRNGKPAIDARFWELIYGERYRRNIDLTDDTIRIYLRISDNWKICKDAPTIPDARKWITKAIGKDDKPKAIGKPADDKPKDPIKDKPETKAKETPIKPKSNGPETLDYWQTEGGVIVMITSIFCTKTDYVQVEYPTGYRNEIHKDDLAKQVKREDWKAAVKEAKDKSKAKPQPTKPKPAEETPIDPEYIPPEPEQTEVAMKQFVEICGCEENALDDLLYATPNYADWLLQTLKIECRNNGKLKKQVVAMLKSLT